MLNAVRLNENNARIGCFYTPQIKLITIFSFKIANNAKTLNQDITKHFFLLFFFFLVCPETFNAPSLSVLLPINFCFTTKLREYKMSYHIIDIGSSSVSSKQIIDTDDLLRCDYFIGNFLCVLECFLRFEYFYLFVESFRYLTVHFCLFPI